MNEYQEIVEQKQKRRYQLLLALWKETNGKEKRAVSFIGIAEKNGFEKEEYDEIYNYFTSEGFFENATFG